MNYAIDNRTCYLFPTNNKSAANKFKFPENLKKEFKFPYGKELKPLWKKRYCSFCHNAFKSRLLQRRLNASKCGKGKIM